jgi:hypothetical protein
MITKEYHRELSVKNCGFNFSNLQDRSVRSYFLNPTTHITVLWTFLVETNALHHVTVKTPNLFRRWWEHSHYSVFESILTKWILNFDWHVIASSRIFVYLDRKKERRLRRFIPTFLSNKIRIRFTFVCSVADIYHADLLYYRQSKSVAMATVINQGQKRTAGSVPSCFKVQIRFAVACHFKKTQIDKFEPRSFIGTLTFQQVIRGWHKILPIMNHTNILETH